MENDPSSRYQEPEPTPADDAIIRDIMDKKGVSYADARLSWEMTKAEVMYKNLQEQESEEDTNG